MAGGSTSHRTSRGRSHGRRKKLPPIPERSLSSQKQKARGESIGRNKVRGGGAPASSDTGVVSSKKKKSARSSGVQVAPPTPESRRRGTLPLSHQRNASTAVIAVESRDDDHEDLPLPSQQESEKKRPLKEIMVTPVSTNLPPPVPSPTSVSNLGGAQALPTSNQTALSRDPSAIPSSNGETRILSGEEAGTADKTAAILPSSTSKASHVAAAGNHHKSTAATNINRSSNCGNGTIQAEKLADAITPFTSNISRKRIAAVVGSTCDDSRAADKVSVTGTALVERQGPEDEDGILTKKKEYTPIRRGSSGSHSYYHASKHSNLIKGQSGISGSNGSSNKANSNSSLILKTKTDVPEDEIMDSFMRRPYGQTPNKPRYYGDEIMDSTSRETRDQYQLGRLRARIDRRSGVNGHMYGEIVSKVGKASPPTDYKTLRSSRLKMRRNLYQNQKPGDDDQDNQKYQVDLEEQERKEEQKETLYQQQEQPPQSPPVSPQQKRHQRSYSSMSDSVHCEGGGGGSIANNTSSTIPSIQHGQSIGRSLTLSSGVSVVPGASNSGAQQTAASQTQQSISNSAGLHSRVPSICNNSAAGAQSRVHSISNSAYGIGSQRRSISNASIELSEYRGKLFAKMLHLLQDISATHPEKGQSLHEDDVSNIKEMVLDEGRASCCSIAELKLIQKLTEEEMSRILYEFEQNNSLVEKKEQGGYNSTPDFKYQSSRDVPPPANNDGNIGVRRMGMQDEGEDGRDRGNDNGSRCPPPERIIYTDNNPMTILSKVSDVTSPTCHDGFELDEIMPVPFSNHPPIQQHQHQQPGMSTLPPRSPKNNQNWKQRMPPSPGLSPAAAAAANAAVSMTLTSPPQQLPSVLEIPDTYGFDDDNDSGNGNKAVGTNADNENIALLEKKDQEKETDGNCKVGLATIDDVGKDAMHRLPTPKNKYVEKNFNDQQKQEMRQNDINSSVKTEASSVKTEPAKVAELLEDVNSSRDSGLNAAAISPAKQLDMNRVTNDEDLEAVSEERIAAVLASSRAAARDAAREEHFHDEILNAVAKAEDATSFTRNQASGKGGHGISIDELDEVTSILSIYEDAEKRAMEQEMEPGSSGGMENEQYKAGNVGDASPLDDLVEVEARKVVTFLEPLQEAQNDAVCGCGIQ